MLQAIGVAHRVVASVYPEDDVPGLAPSELVVEHARAKAADVAARSGIPAAGAVLGADTAVVLDGAVLGKPADRDQARAMLTDLSGRTHRVMTGVALHTHDGVHTFVDVAEVTFRQAGRDQIDWYLERGEWQGRAGGYAIQGSGATLVAEIAGDFTTIVGLPVGRLAGLLAECGLAPWSGRGALRRA